MNPENKISLTKRNIRSSSLLEILDSTSHYVQYFVPCPLEFGMGNLWMDASTLSLIISVRQGPQFTLSSHSLYATRTPYRAFRNLRTKDRRPFQQRKKEQAKAQEASTQAGRERLPSLHGNQMISHLNTIDSTCCSFPSPYPHTIKPSAFATTTSKDIQY